MPKFVIALVSSALAGMIGLLLGAVFTVPKNEEMEALVNAKAEMTQQIQVLRTENVELLDSTTKLEDQVQKLKNKLLRAYEIEKETETF